MNAPSTPFVGDPVEPGVRRFVDAVTAAYAGHPDFGTLSLAARRDVAEQVRAPWATGGPVMSHVEEIEVPAGRVRASVRVRVLRPALEGRLPALVYLHGGGWTMFSLDTHERLMREYAARAGVVVIGVDYALAPEHRFPVAIDEVVDVIEWLAQPGTLPGIDEQRLAIGGDSAGANLAMASAIRLRDLGKGKLLRALVINYGAFDPSPAYRSYEAFGDGRYLLSSAEMKQFWNNYLRDERDARDPLAAPVVAELAGLPPAFFAITELDVLHDENVHMAERLRDAQVDVTQVVYAGTVHSFLEAVSVATVSNTALDDTSAWLRAQLASVVQ